MNFGGISQIKESSSITGNKTLNPGAVQENNTYNASTVYFSRCLGIYHLLSRPTGHTFSTYISVTIILSIFSIVSAFGNGLIIYVYLKQKSLQHTSTLLLMCLAFLDFVSAIVLEPLYIVRLLSEIFGFTSCAFILIVRRLLEYLRPVSFMTLALITVERYLALFKAITHRRMVTKQRLLYVVLVIWFVWFLVICIRSFFPRITSAFYTFFTFVAFSLLVGNIVMYFKIGKLARLHSRSTRVSTAPGSLSVGYKSPGSIVLGSKNPGAACTQARANVKCVLNEKSSSAKIGIQPSESVVKTTTIDVQPSEKTSTERDVFSREDGEPSELGYDVHSNNLPNNLNALNPQALDNATTIKERAKEKDDESYCEQNNNKYTSETSKVKDRYKKRVFKNENEKHFTRTSSTHRDTQALLVVNNTSVYKPECGDDITGHIEAKQDTDGCPPGQFQSNGFANEIARERRTSEGILETETASRDGTTSNPKNKIPSQARDVSDSKENKINSKSVNSFKNTKQASETFKVETNTTSEKTSEATLFNEARREAKNPSQTENTKPTFSSATCKLQSTEKTNKTTSPTTSRASIKNIVKLETRERNATWTVFYIVAILTLCYLPISGLLLYLSFQKEPNATTLFICVPITDTVALFNALVNPFIYCFKNRKMRAAVKRVFQRTRNSS